MIIIRDSSLFGHNLDRSLNLDGFQYCNRDTELSEAYCGNELTSTTIVKATAPNRDVIKAGPSGEGSRGKWD